MDDKKFVMPKAEIVSYFAEDIITQSLTDEGQLVWGQGDGEDW